MRAGLALASAGTCLVLAAAATADPSAYEPGQDPEIGFNLVAWKDGSSAAEWEAAVQALYDAGLRRLTIVTYRFVDASTGGVSATSVHGLAAPPGDAVLAAAMVKAAALGMTVSLNPFIEKDNASGIGHEWRGNLDFSGAALTDFFTNYQAYIASMATLAESAGAARLYVGSELRTLADKTAENTQAHWSDVITAARGNFSGTLSYAANHDNYAAVPFWDQLDEIGIDAYFALATSAQASGVGNPSVGTLVSNWATILSAVEAFASGAGKPVAFSEWGCVAKDLTTTAPWDWNPSATADAAEQLNAYQSLLEATDHDATWLRDIALWHWSMEGAAGSAFAIEPTSLPGQMLSGYVPEPATLALVAVGAAVALGRGRWNRVVPRRAGW